MFGRFIIAFFLFQLCFFCANAQVNLTGYINNYSLLGETRPDPFDETLWQNMTSQRFNFNWSINNNFDIYISSRTNFSIGNSNILKMIKETSTDDNNLMKLSYSFIDKDDKWLGVALDRLALRWATDEFEITLGRQRINWGNTILWNPNDIFDSSPVISFTYPEKWAVMPCVLHFITARLLLVKLLYPLTEMGPLPQHYYTGTISEN